jgi:hypothetical protein
MTFQSYFAIGVRRTTICASRRTRDLIPGKGPMSIAQSLKGHLIASTLWHRESDARIQTPGSRSLTNDEMKVTK